MFRENDIQTLLVVMQTGTVSANVFLYGLRLSNISRLKGFEYHSFLHPASSIRNLLSIKKLLPAYWLNVFTLQRVNSFSNVVLQASVDIANTTGFNYYNSTSVHPLKVVL